MKNLLIAGSTLTIMVAASLFFVSTAHQPVSAAESCRTDKTPDELERAEAEMLYDCVIETLVSGWRKGDHPVALEYRDWTPASTYAAATGTHSNRLLFTYVNDVAKDAYLSFAEENVTMPVGSIIAKESFGVGKKGDKKGKPVAGPLFPMEKVAKGSFDETGNWKYTLITPGGKAWLESGKTEPAKIAKFCHDCHEAVLEDQDAMFYPAEEARVGSD